MIEQHTPGRVEDLAQRFARAVDAVGSQDADRPDGRMTRLYPAIWAILADGRPASAAEIAEFADRRAEDVAEIIAGTPQAEVDRDGRVLGAALTLLPTPHRVVVPGRTHQLYLWCVPDALMVSRILGQPLRVVSPCHATGRELTLEVQPDAVRAVDPPSAVMAFVSACDLSDVRGTVCAHQNLFVSAEAAAPWLDAHPQAAVVPVSDSYRVMAPVIAAIGSCAEACC